MTTWFYTKPCLESGYKGHFGPVEIMSALSDNLLARGMKQQETEAGPHIDSFFIDNMGGMISLHAHVSEIEIDGVVLKFHTQHFRYVLDAVERSPERKDIGEGHVYHKIHGRFNCLCLLPEQHDTLLLKLRGMEKVALAVESAECEEMARKLSGNPFVIYVRDTPDVVEA